MSMPIRRGFSVSYNVKGCDVTQDRDVSHHFRVI